MPDEVCVVLEWEAAVNGSDPERLVQLTDPEVVLVGSRGRVAGHDVLRQWLERARLQSRTRRHFHRDGVVVADQGVVKEYERYDELLGALEAAGLTGKDEVDAQ